MSMLISWENRYDDPESIEVDLEIKFNGEGWYFKKGDSMLIRKEAGDYYVVSVWNGIDGQRFLRDLANMPVVGNDKWPK